MHVNAKRGSTFTFTRSLSNIASILVTQVNFKHVRKLKFTQQGKSTLIHVCGTRKGRYVSRFQAKGGKREARGERETEKGAQKIYNTRARLVLYARFALAFARLKNAKKKATPILPAARTEEEN